MSWRVKKNNKFECQNKLTFSSFSCSSHGQCRVGAEGLFECRCNDGYDGVDCSLPLEKDCKDGKDNDKGELQKEKKCQSVFYTCFFLNI